MALRRAWFIWFDCPSSRSATVLSSSGLSHADCFSASGPSRLCVVLAVFHLILSYSRISSFVEAAFPSMMAWSESVLAADARKAGRASEVTERMPSPPLLMGSEAWIHASSVRRRLRIMLKPDLNSASYFVSSGWSAQGQQRRVCSSLVALTEYLNSMRVSCVATSASLYNIRLSSALRAVRASDNASRVE